MQAQLSKIWLRIRKTIANIVVVFIFNKQKRKHLRSLLRANLLNYIRILLIKKPNKVYQNFLSVCAIAKNEGSILENG